MTTAHRWFGDSADWRPGDRIDSLRAGRHWVGFCIRPSNRMPPVTQSGTLLYRRLETCIGLGNNPTLLPFSASCRLPVGDTADYQSALRKRPPFTDYSLRFTAPLLHLHTEEALRADGLEIERTGEAGFKPSNIRASSHCHIHANRNRPSARSRSKKVPGRRIGRP